MLKDKNSIRQTHHLLYGGYMFRPFIRSSSDLLWNNVDSKEGLMMTLKRVETCKLHTINYVFDVYCFMLSR